MQIKLWISRPQFHLRDKKPEGYSESLALSYSTIGQHKPVASDILVVINETFHFCAPLLFEQSVTHTH